METSCGNITHNQCRDASSEKDLRDINSKNMANYNDVDGDFESAFDQNSVVKDNFLESNDQIKTIRPLYSDVIDSDSEDNDIAISLPRINVIEDDSESVIFNGSLEKNNIERKKNKTMAMDNDSINGFQYSIEKEEDFKKAVKRFETLVDSDSDEDDNQMSTFMVEDNECIKLKKTNKNVAKSTNNKKESNRKTSIRACKEEAMRQIHSETQRLIRETAISLPYHRPKLRTLQEFLNRKKVSVTLPDAPTTASKLKMSYAIVSKVLEDKEKEAEEFYKSSDSEEEAEKVAKHVSEPNIKDASTSYIANETRFFGDINCVLDENTEKVLVDDKDKGSGQISFNVSDEVEKPDADLSKNIEDYAMTNGKVLRHLDHDKNDEIVVREIVDKLLELVNYKVEKYDKGKLEENIVSESATSEICLEKIEYKVPEAIDNNISLDKDNNDKPYAQASGDNHDIDTSVLENTIEKTVEHIQSLPLSNFVYKEEKRTKKQSLQDKKINIEPRLKGSPGMIIDLSCDMKSNKKGVENLINRFLSKHTASDKDVEETTEINVVHLENTTDGLKTVKRSLLYKKPLIDKEDPELGKPGAKLKRLKEDLKFKMAMKRNEEWKQKEQELKDNELEMDDISVHGMDNEEKLQYESNKSGESEPEENDVPMVDKRYKPLCEFADDEAEESENEDDDDDDDDDDGEEEEKEEEEEEEVDVEEEGEEEDNYEDEEEKCEQNHIYENNDDDSNDDCIKITKKWKPKRIIKAFEDDSNLSPSKTSTDRTNEAKTNVFGRTTTNVDLFETNNDNCSIVWNSDEENDVSILQKNNQSDLTQICKTPSIKPNVLDFVSPITQLTILHASSNSSRKNSAKKDEFVFVNNNESFSQTHMPFNATSKSRYGIDKRLKPQKKLFDDYNDVTNDEDLMQLCSGAFPSTQMIDLNQTSSKETSLLTANASNGCMTDVQKADKDILLENETSQDMKLYLDENSVSPRETGYTTKENAPWNKLSVVFSSDSEDDSDDEDKAKIKKKRHPKKLELSDDDEDDSRQGNLRLDKEKVDGYVDYDSEENEIIVSKKSKNNVAAEFFEEEAELSESDWDSADEDEKDLDKLELEEGDEDEIDENKVRNQLEKIHMRQILDQDQREVRMLQELLFEDGDLHTEGNGRERKFKWKNIDKLGENNEASRVDDDTNAGLDLQENENELEWCKLRHERDKFLEEKKRAVDEEIEEDLGKSEIFKFGVKLLKKIESEQSEKQDSSGNGNEPMIEPIMPRNLSDLLNAPGLEGRKSAINTIMKKRSFLSRGEEELDRIAKRVRLNDTINLAPANTKNFVFAHVTPPVKKVDDEENENIHVEDENESNDKTFRRRKRKATPSSSTTPKTTKRVKQERTDPERKKTL
ncbi:claspin-like [Vespula squamosa]|uniref:Claspin-like n=1 Tax=Vespula squamosa TaxID=30214 RepID=A0ABD2B8L2_VESSQ